MDEKVFNSLQFIKDNVEKYGDDICLISSFGKDSNVVIHLVIQVAPNIPVLWVKPPFLPAKTHKLSERLTAKWGLNLVEVESHLLHDHDFMRDIVYKPNIPKSNPELCCQLFKDEPLFKKVIEMKMKAWFSGLRGTESEKRGMFTEEWRQGDFVKLHPILDWTEADVWRYTAVRQIPVHSWYGLGYRSLGCEPCSFPNVWNSERGGRFKDTAMEGLSCGIHCIPPFAQKSEWKKYFGEA